MAKKKEEIRDLHFLSKAWLHLKADEEINKEVRYGIEEEIAALLPGPDEGTESTKDGGLKISVTRKLTRTIDAEAYEAYKGRLPASINPVRYKPELDLKKLRAIESANPDVLAICQKFISVKPSKVSIKIEEVKND